jgi:hypothetical protein
MTRTIVVIIAAFAIAACGRPNAPPAADSTALAQHADDSIIALRTQQAPAIADTARMTLKVLLKHPERALFDSIVVVQPPKEDGRWPTPFVCGRIGGKPGIGGRNAMTPFVYQNRVNVFVLDQSNGPAFAALRARGCDNPAGRVLLR